MSGLEMMGMGCAAAAGIGLGLLNAPRPAAREPLPAHARVFAEREAVDGDTPVLDAAASRLHDEDGAELGCGGG